MKVLLSIKPEFVAKIIDGSKHYEYRRVLFRRQDVKTVVVYASNPIKKIIGEFKIGEIMQDSPISLWSMTKNFSGTTEERFFKYFANRSIGYAIKIESVSTYDVPKSLESFGISSPPQSFRYLSD